MDRVIELDGTIQQKQKEMADIFAQYPDLRMSKETVEDIQHRNAELTDLGTERDRLFALRQIEENNRKSLGAAEALIRQSSNTGMVTPSNGADPTEQAAKAFKSLGERFTESAEYKMN